MSAKSAHNTIINMYDVQIELMHKSWLKDPIISFVAHDKHDPFMCKKKKRKHSEFSVKFFFHRHVFHFFCSVLQVGIIVVVPSGMFYYEW